MSGSQPPTPRAYSTQTGGNGGGSHVDGYSVVIDPGTLEKSISDFRGKLALQGSCSRHSAAH